MDIRKVLTSTEENFSSNLTKQELNLDIAQNIENMINLEDLIKTKANITYKQNLERNQFWTIFSTQQNLTDKPKTVLVVSLVGWVILWRKNIASKIHLVYVLFLVGIYANYSKDRFYI